MIYFSRIILLNYDFKTEEFEVTQIITSYIIFLGTRIGVSPNVFMIHSCLHLLFHFFKMFQHALDICVSLKTLFGGRVGINFVLYMSKLSHCFFLHVSPIQSQHLSLARTQVFHVQCWAEYITVEKMSSVNYFCIFLKLIFNTVYKLSKTHIWLKERHIKRKISNNKGRFLLTHI